MQTQNLRIVIQMLPPFETYGQWFFCEMRKTFCMDDVYPEMRCGIWSYGFSSTHAWYVSIDESRSDTGMNAYGIYCRGFKCVSLGSCKNREFQMHVLMRENQ